MVDTPTITEIKYRPGRKPESWTCDLIEIDAPKSARVRYLNDADVEIEGTLLPAGTVTEAVYWSDRPYHVWKMTSPDGRLLGHRFDVCMNTFIWPQKIIWTDLGYDLWVPADGEARWQDVSEVEQMARMESLSYEDVALANDGRARLDAEWADVIREAFG